MAKSKNSSDVTESKLPALAKAATALAYRRARRSGSVLVYKNGEIRQIEPDGENRLVKTLEPRIRMPKGAKFEIKAAEAA